MKFQLKNGIWLNIAQKFGEDDKKLLLKWKNLKRKYILMRYPQSSKNHITQKRRVRYSQKFIDKMSFLDPYLEYSSLFEPVTDNSYYESEAKRMKMDTNLYTQPHQITSKSTSTPNITTVTVTRKIVPKKPRKSVPLKIETLHQHYQSGIQQQNVEIDDDVIEIPSIEIDDDTEEGVTVEDENILDSSTHFQDDEFLQHEQQSYNESTNTDHNIVNYNHESISQRGGGDMREAGSIESECDRRIQYSHNELFCLSLVESLNALSQRKQNQVKEMFWRIINEFSDRDNS